MIPVPTALLRTGCALFLALFCQGSALAQSGIPGPTAGVPTLQGSTTRNPVCPRLESQLAMIDREGALDPAKAEQVRRYEEAAGKQQAELDRLGQQSQRYGCQGAGFFSLFSGQSPQCGPLNNQIQQVRANLDRLLADIQRLQGNSGEREGERRSVLAALGQNDCGPQYRQYATAPQGGFFEQLFGVLPGAASFSSGPQAAGTYRTLCVRTCDGYYFPISYATVPAKFADDEQSCRRLCPAADVALFSHRNPGEEVSQAISMSGKLYSELPAAFSYRKQLNPSCSCRAPGQSWADALRQGDDLIERGDIVVTEERAKQLSQPRFDAQGKPIAPDNQTKLAPGLRSPNAGGGSNASVTSAPLAPAGTPQPAVAEEKAAEEGGKRNVRTVGPNFFPVPPPNRD
jgi:Protein of unknown function (DUF2865)